MSKRISGRTNAQPRRRQPARQPGARQARSSDAMNPPAGGAAVRMYCAGLGDCFLLAFRGDDGQPRYVMVDCGVWRGTLDPGARMRRIMQNIKDTVGPHGIDVLVVTHAHWDHVSGFDQARDIYNTIPVREIWLPWTENAADPFALQMAKTREQAMQAAAAASSRLQQLAANLGPNTTDGQAARAAADNIDNTLGFMVLRPGQNNGDDATLLAAAAVGTDEVMKYVQKEDARIKYLKPDKKPVRIDGLCDVPVYVLGPPTDPKFLGKDDPSTAPGKRETYLAGGLAPVAPLNADAALRAAARAAAGATAAEDEDQQELLYPFDHCERIPDQAAFNGEHADFFTANYGQDNSGPQAWRRIDADWLMAAEHLALNLDDHVNNTSLVLAFQLGGSNESPVLLFTGDAQVGNWLSWHKLDDDGKLARSLLKRTVLYKVGHHASHNATLRALGLKLMSEKSRLVAMIPVDELEARKPKGKNQDGWEMPYGKLLTDLEERTEGRVLRSDKPVTLLESGQPEGWSSAKWNRFRKAVVVRETNTGNGEKERLFIQYTVC